MPAGTYAMEVTPTGEETVNLAIPDVPLSAGAVYGAFVVGRAEDGTLELPAASDAGTVDGQQEAATLPVVGQAGSDPALVDASVPDTGGVSPALLLCGAALLVPGLLLALLIGTRRGAPQGLEHAPPLPRHGLPGRSLASVFRLSETLVL